MSHPCTRILAPEMGEGKAASSGGTGEEMVRDGGENVLAGKDGISPPRLYILCGLPFAGKSTLAQALADREGLTFIAIDAINTERGLGINAAPIAPEQWDGTYAEAYRRLESALAAGQSVIFDAASFTREQRDDLRTIAARHGARARVLWVDVPAATATARWRRNRQTRTRYDVRDEDFAQVVDRFEPPTDDEDALRYEESLPLAAWLDLVC